MGAMEVHRMWCGLKLLEKILGEIKLMLDPEEDISTISMREGILGKLGVGRTTYKKQ